MLFVVAPLIVAMAMVVMGDVCTKYYGQTYYYQQLIGCYVGKVLVVVGENIAMAMVVVGHICTQSIMVIHNTIY